VVKDQGVIVGRASNFLCTGFNTNPISIPVVLKPAPVGTVRVETSESCSDGSSQKAVPAFAYVINGTAQPSGYTQAASGSATVAIKDFTSILTGTKQVYAQNPRTGTYVLKSVSVTANSTATAAFNFPVTCPTGGGN
jgi:hypothetical protein